MYFLIVFLLLNLYARKDFDTPKYIKIWGLTILSSLTLIISFSRSIWLGLGIVLILILLYLIVKEKFNIKKISKLAFIIVIVVILELGAITLIVNIKLPNLGGGGVSIASLVKDRLSDTDEAALISRYELLKPLTNKFLENPIIGHGFGTKVSFISSDPRTKDINGGVYTTYAFEWGYLDILVKIGLLGLLSILYFIYKIIRVGVNSVKNTNDKYRYSIGLSLIFSILALLIVHTTTPYINHPLGIFLLVIAAPIFHVINKESTDKA